WRRDQATLRSLVVTAVGVALFYHHHGGLTPVWWALLLVAAGSVLLTMLMRAAIETLIDPLHPKSHPAMERARDMAAALVPVAGAVAPGVGVLAGFYGLR
ncbi:diacylglycerol kinase, partial [Sulfurivirga sp.]|uniref:diacylglycerol kinase n=1 Tax=Sulfurivirga sp. TaxID=2614236 RepID=UPI0025E4E22A